jgi:hypothetical protein
MRILGGLVGAAVHSVVHPPKDFAEPAHAFFNLALRTAEMYCRPVGDVSLEEVL